MNGMPSVSSRASAASGVPRRPPGGFNFLVCQFAARLLKSRMPLHQMATAASPLPPGCPFFQYFANGLVFLLAMAFAAVLLGRWLPYPNIPEAGEKIHYLAAYGNDYDTLFTGSSRVNFQVVPTLFDEFLAGHGRASKSFNAGIIGMRPPEQGFFLDEVLRRPHRQLRWVLIELTSIEAYTPPARRGSARYVFWHDGPRMMLLGTWVLAQWTAMRSEASANGSKPHWTDYFEPISIFLTHLPAFFEKELNFGGAAELGEWLRLTPSQRAKRGDHWAGLGKDRDGWMPYSVKETMNDDERAAYQKSYEARLQSPAVQFHDPATDASVQAMSEAVTHAGATPIFIIPPTTSDQQYFYPPPEASPEPDHLEFLRSASLSGAVCG